MMNAKELKAVIHTSLATPNVIKDAKDFVDAQERRIKELEAKLQECEGSDNTTTGARREAGFSSDGTL